MTLPDLAQNVATNYPEYLKLAGDIIAVASFFAAVTPTPVDDGVLKILRTGIQYLSLGVGHAKK